MPYQQFDRNKVRMKPLAERASKVDIEDILVIPETEIPPQSDEFYKLVDETATRVIGSRSTGASRIISFGADTINKGLAPVLTALIEEGWITHLATNGSGATHDWEISYIGKTSEDSHLGLQSGELGNWQETGYFVNLALNIGAFRGLGYSESLGALIQSGGVEIPSMQELRETIFAKIETDPAVAAAAMDLLYVMKHFEIEEGWRPVPHRWKEYSIQAAAYRLRVPFTAHPIFGQDIIFNHPLNCGSLLGRVAERDFLSFADSVSRLSGGVYISIDSSVISPLVFEKSVSISQNILRQQGGSIEDLHVLVVDLIQERWDWSKGDPPEESPDYFFRYNASFHESGSSANYLRAENRYFLPALLQKLREKIS